MGTTLGLCVLMVGLALAANILLGLFWHARVDDVATRALREVAGSGAADSDLPVIAAQASAQAREELGRRGGDLRLRFRFGPEEVTLDATAPAGVRLGDLAGVGGYQRTMSARREAAG